METNTFEAISTHIYWYKWNLSDDAASLDTFFEHTAKQETFRELLFLLGFPEGMWFCKVDRHFTLRWFCHKK